jgi:hypothetical protein
VDYIEHWVKILDFPDYSVSDLGRVRNNRTDRILRGTSSNRGTLTVLLLGEDGGKYRRSVARLVWAAFRSPKGLFADAVDIDTIGFVNHDKTDCRAGNLVSTDRATILRRHRQRR